MLTLWYPFAGLRRPRTLVSCWCLFWPSGAPAPTDRPRGAPYVDSLLGIPHPRQQSLCPTTSMHSFIPHHVPTPPFLITNVSTAVSMRFARSDLYWF